MENKIKRGSKHLRKRSDQRSRISEMLVRLAPDVTTGDRRAAAEFLQVTLPTVASYLRGVVLNNDRGLDMVAFFKNRIEKRGIIIRALCEQSKKG